MAEKRKKTETVEERDERFKSHKGEVKVTMPQCKECDRCIISNGLSCTIKHIIPLNIRLNKENCIDFVKKSR